MPYEYYDITLSLLRVYKKDTGFDLTESVSQFNEMWWKALKADEWSLPPQMVLPHINWTAECPSRLRRPMPTLKQLKVQVEGLLSRLSSSYEPLLRDKNDTDTFSQNTHDAAATNFLDKSSDNPYPSMTTTNSQDITVVYVSGDFQYSNPLWFLWRQVLDSPFRSYNSHLDCSQFYTYSDAATNSANHSSNRDLEDETRNASELTEMMSPYQCIFLAKSRVEFRLIPYPVKAEDVREATQLLLIPEEDIRLATDVLQGVRNSLPSNISLGLLVVGMENCVVCDPIKGNTVRSLTDLHPNLHFAFITYGDCYLLNNENVFIWPLGTSAPNWDSSFPSNFLPLYNPRASQRPLLLNMMASFTLQKPTRMPAWIAARQYCTERQASCVLGPQATSDSLLSKILAVASVSRSPDISTALQSLFVAPPFSLCTSKDQKDCTSSRYMRTLRSSVFTLSPQGNNPESFRTWEAIIAGSIPIVDEYDKRLLTHPLHWYHAAYKTDFACDFDRDVNLWLRETDAPVLWIKSDWRDELGAHLLRFTQSNGTGLDLDALDAHQTTLRVWYNSLIEHLQLLLLSQILQHAPIRGKS